MPTVTNPADFDLFCVPLGELVAAGATVGITDAQAAELAGSPVFVVDASDVPPVDIPVAVVDPEPDEAAPEVVDPQVAP